MDPRNNLQNPFARPLSQSSARDPRQAPIPPPPYTLQAPAHRLQPSLNNDPFLPRRNERDESRPEPPKSLSQGPFTIGSYAAGLPRDALGMAMEIRDRPQENNHSGSWVPRVGDGRADRYRHHASERSSLPPPPPSATFASSLQDPSTQRDAVRQPEHRTSSPRMYGGHDNPPPPPPPPPFSGRPMLPPSPQYNAQASMSRVPPPPPPFSGGRELPALSTTNRPGSSMSISSMLGTDPGRATREPAVAPLMNGTSPPLSYSSAQQAAPTPSPTRSSNSNVFLHRGSPDKHHVSQDPGNRPFRAYSGGTPQRSYATVKATSPDGARQGPLSATATSKYSPTSENGIMQEWRQQNRNSITGRLQNRPNSQPNGYSILPFESDRAMAELEAHRQAQAKQEEDNKARDEALRYANRDRVSSFDYLSRQEQLERQRRLEQEAQSATHGSSKEERISGLNYPFLTQSSVFSEPSASAPQPELESYANRLVSDTQSKSSTPKGPYSEDSLRRLREERQRLNQQTTSYSPSASRPRFPDTVDERQSQAYPHNVMLSTSATDGPASTDGPGRQTRVGEDAGQNHRSMLSMIENKRLGRTSPIPQAVQGAQVQKRGPSTDPTIKNEFSRMFAGLGTGVSSTGMNSGASTPFPPPSPKPSTEPERRPPFNGRGELVEFARARNGSKIGKRASKKVKDDDLKETEVADGRSTTGPSGTRGIKRKSAHHHHHHDHEHGHHHHHHRQDGLNGSTMRDPGNSATPVSHHHHHHHHHHPDGTIHYHNHSKVPIIQHKTAPRMPSATIKNDEILDKVRNLPRQHLGSILYSPTIEPPTSMVSLDSKLMYTSSPFTIPRCDGKENCTMTIRIPRFYLSKEEREQVCLRRAVWGTDVYSDDTDPLAAAVHAGWIRGDWGDSIDVSMLELNTVNGTTDTKQTEYTTLPSSPLLPPARKDLHLTILILPTLENYASHISHGIRSRPWGNDHDGLSYRIEKIAWVDEKASQGEERGGEARRKRLRMTTGKGNGPALRLGLGKSLGASKVGMVAA
ncbi:hypothetical protein HO133_004866 [Letharia lupina]|uniref:Rxt3-domain-containing protein n=1 Tax=Letharia lupina TaxID=560253 RepID=A0A8H6L044_9LECA|nr:uncharacterized protein HO133_004866 [Letharia lupina]KAF6230522.1 hypothetical protein HO133_004866 [Letharia lupina]